MTTSPTGKRKNKGFLLMELMVGISVLSIGLLFAMDSLARAAVAIKISKDLFGAGLMLEENIYKVYNTDREEGVEDGTSRVHGAVFTWSVDIKRIEEYSLDEAAFNIFSNQEKSRTELTAVTYFI
ncbi:MAG: prepilin-type N-terminal cleavage/methylation domain-containing protein [Candidatus Omnitrophica bacterium]|nr:prepilin-type N-terminal cleavage/methylation domain-containing protein [Candidatus Omnitrophota bacterium]